MKQSTKELMGKHGWRIDRAIHNYIYFAFYSDLINDGFVKSSAMPRRVGAL